MEEEAAGDRPDSFVHLLTLVIDRNGIDGVAWIIWLFGVLPNIDENHGNNENHNNENHDNVDDLDNDNVNDNVDFDNIDNHNVDNDDGNNENAADADAAASAEVAVGVGQDVEEHDLLPRRSLKRSREEDEADDEERSRKRFRWCDDDDCSSDIDAGSICSDHNNTDENTEHMAVEHAGASAEEDPLPGPSTKWPREHDREENKYSSSKTLRQCHEFTDSDSDTDTDTTGHNLAQISCDVDPSEDEGAVEDTDEEDSQQVEEEDPRPSCSGKRSRKRDDRKGGRGSKRWRR